MRDHLSSDPVTHDKPVDGSQGQRVQADTIEQLQRLQPRFYAIGEQAWCMVGNGLSNQTFVRGPQGIIAIDSGESIEEMADALQALREVTTEPVVACIYTHFHYVNGTQAILQEGLYPDLRIIGHAGIAANLNRFGGEVAPRSSLGLVHQFGTSLPADGPDALLHCGLGRFLRNPAHAPYTPGYVPARETIERPTTLQIAGLTVDITPAPSDSNDSITIWFPQLQLCVNNLVWPALFNIYAIRGEEYRDPRLLLAGIDHIIDLAPQALIGTHGPPIEAAVSEVVTRYRDAIQFIWDQTVRHLNKGASAIEAAQAIELPAEMAQHYTTRQFYGVVEHHVRQIQAGLFGWFDGTESELLPLAPHDRHSRLIEGFGGRESTRQQAAAALAEQDWRWAIELATWLVRSPDCSDADQHLLAAGLRGIAQHTNSANLRNWSLTRALELEGRINLDRFRQHRFSLAQVLAAPPSHYVATLRVLLIPQRARGLNIHLGWRFLTGAQAGLHIRHQVAVATDGGQPDVQIGLSHENWADILANKRNIWEAIEAGLVSVVGDREILRDALQCFDLESFK